MVLKVAKECPKAVLRSLVKEAPAQTQAPKAYMEISTRCQISKIFQISKTNLAQLVTLETLKLRVAAEL
jgi:hypothetical protein